MYLDPTAWVQWVGFFLLKEISLEFLLDVIGSTTVTVVLMFLSGDLNQ